MLYKEPNKAYLDCEKSAGSFRIAKRLLNSNYDLNVFAFFPHNKLQRNISKNFY